MKALRGLEEKDFEDSSRMTQVVTMMMNKMMKSIIIIIIIVMVTVLPRPF